MFMLTYFLLFMLSLGTLQLIEVKSNYTAIIKTVTSKDSVNLISYEKLARDTSEVIFLSFNFLGESTLSDLELKVNKVLTPIEKVESPVANKKISIMKDKSSYKILFPKMDSVKGGEYNLCGNDGSTTQCASSFIYSQPIVAKFPNPKMGLEGGSIRIRCSYEAYPEATKIIWSIINHGTNLSTANITEIRADNDHIKIITDIESSRTNDTLFIDKLYKNDSGVYMCTVLSASGKDFALVKINVKDRWAALYPFIGIVIEVIILVVAILVSERYRMKTKNSKDAKEAKEAHDTPLIDGQDNIGADNGVPPVAFDGDKANNNAEVRPQEATNKNV